MIGLNLSLGIGSRLSRSVSDVPSSFYEPSAWAWFDGRTEVAKTTALSSPDGTVNNLFFSGWFSPEDVGVVSPLSGVLGLFYAYDNDATETGIALSINRVALTAPVNRFAMKDSTATFNTTSTVYANAAAPVNSNRYFIACFVDSITPANSVMAIFSGTSWELVTGSLGLGIARDAAEIYPLAIGSHGAGAGSRWYGRMADIFFKTNIDAIDLTVASVRNALLVDPGAAGAGLGIGGGVPDIFFRNSAALFNAGTNAGSGGTFNSIVDGLVANSPYTQVRVTGAASPYLSRASAVSAGIQTFFFSGWINITTGTTAGCAILSLTGGVGNLILSRTSTANGGGLACTASDSLGSGATTATYAGDPDAQTTRGSANLADSTLHHVAVVGDIAGYVTGYVDGVLAFRFQPSVPAMVDFSSHTGIRVAATPTPNQLFNGQLGDVWFSVTLPADIPAALVTLRGSGTPPLLTERNHRIQGVSPLALLGQGMVLSHWNAGKNLGTAGDFTATGSFT